MMTMELVHAKESSMQSPPSRLIIHLRNWSQDSRLFDSKEITRVVKCHPGTQQAAEIRNAIQQAYDSYGNAAQGVRGRFPARKPYAGAQGGAASGTLALTGGPAAPILTSFGALEGPASQTMLDITKNPQPLKADGDQPHTSSTNHHQRAASEGPVQRGIFVYKFERLWWDKGAPWSKKFQVSIWRPQLPSGYANITLQTQVA
jgi:vacuolar protein sorting-associated protein 13A/C